MTKSEQQTLSGVQEMDGVGLHRGNRVTMRLLPGDPDTGIRFRRVDLEGSPDIPATVESVVAHDRGTTLAAGEAQVQTVEHILSALTGLRVDNAVIELDGHEPPAADGSATAFVKMIE